MRAVIPTSVANTFLQVLERSLSMARCRTPRRRGRDGDAELGTEAHARSKQ